jgi:hypothetical protein
VAGSRYGFGWPKSVSPYGSGPIMCELGPNWRRLSEVLGGPKWAQILRGQVRNRSCGRTFSHGMYLARRSVRVLDHDYVIRCPWGIGSLPPRIQALTCETQGALPHSSMRRS